MSGNILSVIRRYIDFAQEQRQEGNLTIAGAYYVAAGHGDLMRFRRDPAWMDEEPFEEAMEQDDYPLSPWLFRYWIGLGPSIRSQIAGCLCYRLADEMDRCQVCCQHMMLFLEDVVDHEHTGMEAPRLGLYYEMIGDLRLIGDLGDHESYYTAAHDRYRGAEHDLGWSMEDDFDDLMLYVLELADSVDYGISDDTREQIYRLSLEARIEFKRDNLPTIIDRVVEDGNWESDIF